VCTAFIWGIQSVRREGGREGGRERRERFWTLSMSKTLILPSLLPSLPPSLHPSLTPSSRRHHLRRRHDLAAHDASRPCPHPPLPRRQGTSSPLPPSLPRPLLSCLSLIVHPVFTPRFLPSSLPPSLLPSLFQGPGETLTIRTEDPFEGKYFTPL